MNTWLSPSRIIGLSAVLQLGAVSLSAHPAATEMAAAADRFLAALSPEQRAKAVFEFKADARLDWHYIPKERKGLTIKEMSTEQRQLAQALLLSGLSQQGYNKATNIMSLEPILFELEGAARKFPRDPELYHFFIFGQPEPKGTWGWRVEGHHVSANFTIVKGQYFGSTPLFFGSNPAEVRQGPRQGLRVLAGEEDLGRRFVKSLHAEQQKKAIIDTTAPREILTEAKRRVQPWEKAGLAAEQLSSGQRDAL